MWNPLINRVHFYELTLYLSYNALSIVCFLVLFGLSVLFFLPNEYLTINLFIFNKCYIVVIFNLSNFSVFLYKNTHHNDDNVIFDLIATINRPTYDL